MASLRNLRWVLLWIPLLPVGCVSPVQGEPVPPAKEQAPEAHPAAKREGGSSGAASAHRPVEAQPDSAALPKGYPVPAPPFSEGIYPCSECHADMEPNTTRRVLTDEHTKIALNHGPRERWCFDCHNPGDRDRLRMASGKLVPYEQSYLLCGQCHGIKLRDWKAGVHGKRTGSWNGKKQYLLCAHCHNPHSPRFKPLKPMPPPARPGNIR